MDFVDETVREFRLTGPPALKSGRSARCSPEDEDGSSPTVPCFAIRVGDRSSRATVCTLSGSEIARD